MQLQMHHATWIWNYNESIPITALLTGNVEVLFGMQGHKGDNCSKAVEMTGSQKSEWWNEQEQAGSINPKEREPSR